MNLLNSPLIIAVSPVLISSVVTLYAIWSNKQINPNSSDQLIKELKREIRELKEKE